MAMTQREKDALDRHLTTEPEWRTGDEGDIPIYVTKTVCVVTPLAHSGLNPAEAAFVGIARDDSEGRYEFTMRGQRYVVTVERPE